MKKITLLLSLVLITFLFTKCKKDFVNPVEEHLVQQMTDLEVPQNFDYKTSKDIVLTLKSFKRKATNQIKYEVYLFDDSKLNREVSYIDEEGNTVNASLQLTDALNNKIATVVTDNTDFTLHVTIPAYIKSLYVVRNEMGVFSSSVVPVNGNKAAFEKSTYKSSVAVNDIFYGTNGNGDLFTIDESTKELTVIGSLPNNDGSYTCAIDPVARKLYTIGNYYPYYLYSYDIDAGNWETVGAVGYGGPRLGYNQNDGLLYFSTYYYVIVLDPTDASILSVYYLSGLQTTSGGDLTFDSEGTMYISTTSGLYRCEFTDGNTINAIWVSSESLPSYPNSLTFDSNDELWWATAIDGEGYTFIMDKVTGGWQERSIYSTVIHDLATLPYDQNAIPSTDSDGDGIIDFYDEYPNDPNKATNTYTPSIYGWGSYAFEDLWPSQGDFDFNDLVLNYRYTNIANADGLVVETKLNFVIKNIGGSFRNGFGIQLNMDASLIQQVSGYRLTEGLISLDGKGLETNQSKPVIIVFDNAWANDKNREIELTITYSEPIDPTLTGNYNPFIFIDGDREREVHLSNMPPTDLANLSYFGTFDDNSDFNSSSFYKDKNNLPWAIDIIHDFVYPKEKSEIILGYPYFAPWAESGGVNYTDWYKEIDGYRNYDYLVQD
ncbi:MAG: LruC domain-containing protein [Bacteroidales bacterium]|nr:LruC domain-containing protein [Bacteroidales bacterium]